MNPPGMDPANFDFSEVCQPTAPPRNAPEINAINKFLTYKEEISYVQRTGRRLTGHILRKNYLLTHIIERKMEGRIEVTGK